MSELNPITSEAIVLLKQLIEIPSISKEEAGTEALLANFFSQKRFPVHRSKNNVWVKSANWKEGHPTILLNSHHDTVKPVNGWTKNPFKATIENRKLFGLGSNDAGGSLVSLIAAFLFLDKKQDLPFNMILAATAEEEISGPNGITSVLRHFGRIYAGIVGEPTGLKMGIAEKGLMVVDAFTEGKAGHAARDNGDNALYKAIQDIQKLKTISFPKNSETLGKTRLSITQIQAGTQHNVIPDNCQWVIDVRTNEHYSNREVFEMLQAQVQSSLKARSFRLNSSGIDATHPLVMAGLKTGLTSYGSPTLSDQALMDFPTIKLGCGDSKRSHTPNEFIYLDEIDAGVKTYVKLLKELANELSTNNQQPTINYQQKTNEKAVG